MLFDLTNPRRKNVVRVVYAVLAALFLIGFVGFGVGSEAGMGGLADIFGSNDEGSTAEQYSDQIEDLEAKLETDPENERVLSQLALLRYQSGQAQLEQDEQTGQPVVTEEARQEFELAVEAWDRYLATKPKEPSVSTAGQMVNAFIFLNDAGGAAEAQAILTEDNPSVNTYGTLATYHYYDLDLKGGDRAIDEARALAEPGDKATIAQLEKLREQVAKEKKRIAKGPGPGATGDNALTDPFGTFGGGASGAPVAP